MANINFWLKYPIIVLVINSFKNIYLILFIPLLLSIKFAVVTIYYFFLLKQPIQRFLSFDWLNYYQLFFFLKLCILLLLLSTVTILIHLVIIFVSSTAFLLVLPLLVASVFLHSFYEFIPQFIF